MGSWTISPNFKTYFLADDAESEKLIVFELQLCKNSSSMYSRIIFSIYFLKRVGMDVL